MRLLAVVVVLLIAALVVVGCGGNPAQSALEQAGIKLNQQGDQVTVSSQGQQITVGSQLPAELKDFPVPTGFKYDGGGTMSSGGATTAAYNWKGSGKVAEVMDFYKKTMPGQGWKEGSTFDSADSSMITYKKGDVDMTIVVSLDNKDKSLINIGVLMNKGSQTPTSQATPTKVASSGAAAATPTAAKPGATATPAGPALVDASNMAAEIRDTIPMPTGYGVVKGSTVRMAQGTKFSYASAELYGTSTVKDVVAFFQKNMPGKGWTEDYAATTDEDASLSFSQTLKSGDKYQVTLFIEKSGAGIQVLIALQNAS